jgi:hypothetical protein
VLTFFALPGNWLIVISTFAFEWWQEGTFSIPVLAVITLLAVAGEIIEFFAGMGGAKKAGAGKRGALGALMGAIVGAIFGTFLLPIPFVGTLTGACVGAGLGAWLLELTRDKGMNHAVRSGVGAGLGVLVGTGSKITLGALICIIVAVAGFWP